MVTKPAVVPAVQLHELADALTANVPVPPLEVAGALDGVRLKVQLTGTPAAWLTVYVWVAMVKVPVRAGPVFGWTVKFTVLLPVPLPVPVSTIQLTLLAAVQVHELSLAVKLADPEVPPAGAEMPTEKRLNMHAAVAAA